MPVDTYFLPCFLYCGVCIPSLCSLHCVLCALCVVCIPSLCSLHCVLCALCVVFIPSFCSLHSVIQRTNSNKQYIFCGACIPCFSLSTSVLILYYLHVACVHFLLIGTHPYHRHVTCVHFLLIGTCVKMCVQWGRPPGSSSVVSKARPSTPTGIEMATLLRRSRAL